uniref:Uncharacterized protein n=1 Tax=Ascaris lumbricoides TaxID=6252 RepID=A0A0M3HSZ7_ASCLU
MFVSFCILTNWLTTFSDTIDQFSPLCWCVDFDIMRISLTFNTSYRSFP